MTNVVISVAVRWLPATVAGELHTLEALEDDEGRMKDQLAALRGCFYQAGTKLSVKAFAEHLAWARRQGLGPMATVDLIDRVEANEIAVAAGEYRAQTGKEYPHL